MRPERGVLATCGVAAFAAALTAGCGPRAAQPEQAPKTSTSISQAASSATSPARTSTSGSASTSASATGLDTFVGTWTGHGRSLVVDKDGTGKIVARTYQWCGEPGVTGACDSNDGNGIKPGAVTQIKISKANEAQGGAVAEFAVVESTLGFPPGSTGVLTFDRAHDALGVTINGKAGDGFYCGPDAEEGYCGA